MAELSLETILSDGNEEIKTVDGNDEIKAVDRNDEIKTSAFGDQKVYDYQ